MFRSIRTIRNNEVLFSRCTVLRYFFLIFLVVINKGSKVSFLLTGYDTCLVWPGLVWSGLVWPGLAWPGLAWPGLAWPGLAWPGRRTLVFHSQTDPRQLHCEFIDFPSTYSRYTRVTSKVVTTFVLKLQPLAIFSSYTQALKNIYRMLITLCDET